MRLSVREEGQREYSERHQQHLQQSKMRICHPGTTDPTNRPIDFNLRSIPTIDIVVNNVTWQITHLICKPGAHLEMREIESGGQSTLTVLPSPSSSSLARQNNLKSTQTNLLLLGVFNNIDGGPQSNAAGPPLLLLDAGLGSRFGEFS